MKRKLALFDFDGTMIKGDSIARLVRVMFKKGIMTLPEMLRSIWNTILWKAGKLPVNTVKSHALSPLNRLTKVEAEAFLRAFVKEELAPRLYPAAISVMREHKEQGDLVLLVSASPLCYLQYMKEHLPLDDILATGTDTQYRVTENLVREEKNRQIKRWLQENGVEADYPNSYAYGDSRNDLNMLSMVGKPRLCNPHGNAVKQAPDIPALIWR